MLLSHAIALAEARSYVAALADTARTFDGSLEYERVLLQLDWIHGDDVPGLDTTDLTEDREVLFALAEPAIEELIGFGSDPLQVELVLAMLTAAQELDEP